MEDRLITSLETLIKYYSNDKLNNVIFDLQNQLRNKDSNSIKQIVNKELVSKETLTAALDVKSVMGKIDVIVHTLGIINTLPYILSEDEVIESISLGADNSKSKFDLVTDKRIAEFKFINWTGKDSSRLKTTFKDYYKLVESKLNKEKYLYLTDVSYFLKCLNGRRSFSNILSGSTRISKEFHEKYNDKYKFINEYYNDNKLKVKLVSLNEIVPNLFN